MKRIASIAVLVGAILVAACGDDDTAGGATTSEAATNAGDATTTEAATPDVTTTAEAPTSTEAATTSQASTTTPPIPPPLEGPRVLENGDFETGDLTGWTMETYQNGEWLVYTDGNTAPNDKYATPEAEGQHFTDRPFELPDPPQGLHAAVSDSGWSAPGVRYLYRDIEVTEPYVLYALVFYQNTWSAFADPGHFELTDEKQTQWYHNQQYRVEIVDPAAPIDSTEPEHIWGTLFHTKSGDPSDLAPTRVSLDLSQWEGQTVRLRLVSVNHLYGPMRAGVDDVDVRTGGAP